MAATTTRSINQLVSDLQRLRPDISFIRGNDFFWNPDTASITYREDVNTAPLLLHEFGHAQLSHTTYEQDIALITMEQSAWQQAELEAKKLSISINATIIDEHMDTYRDWLHARSTCPTCRLTGLQIDTQEYECPACQTVWRVNKALHCELRRYKTKNTP